VYQFAIGTDGKMQFGISEGIKYQDVNLEDIYKDSTVFQQFIG
jgi:hypothetical protein